MSKRRRKFAKATARRLNAELDRVRIALIVTAIFLPLGLIAMFSLSYITYQKHPSPILMLIYATVILLSCYSLFFVRALYMRNKRLLLGAPLEYHIANLRRLARNVAVNTAVVLFVTLTLSIYVSGLYDRLLLLSGIWGSRLLTVAISGIVSNSAYALFVKLFRLGPLLASGKRPRD